MDIITFCSACKKEKELDSIWELADAGGCCGSGSGNDLSGITIIVEDPNAAEFIEQIKKYSNSFPLINNFARHLSDLPAPESILHLIITGRHLVLFSVYSEEFKRKASSVDIYGEWHETMKGRKDSIFYHVYPGEALIRSTQGMQCEQGRTFPLKELCDDFPVMDELDYSDIADIDEDGIIEIHFVSRESALSEFETINSPHISRKAIITIDPGDPSQVECEVVDR